ncbi:hypothetical protein DEU56DRAFT_843556 [Suillus clintonianus]|uniref:uncharacterized protein n=1 Tax=Suillus clintonianus TaxID=1904413 RepID=UPI001B86D146|nr:uncharacterized protein DEU56DRAFT_843556 [Suillus clintonianus]KAG2111463.1 hypothetical protein DEU56DRAFT_843556 [Suillus clintonianus]
MTRGACFCSSVFMSFLLFCTSVLWTVVPVSFVPVSIINDMLFIFVRVVTHTPLCLPFIQTHLTRPISNEQTHASPISALTMGENIEEPPRSFTQSFLYCDFRPRDGAECVRSFLFADILSRYLFFFFSVVSRSAANLWDVQNIKAKFRLATCSKMPFTQTPPCIRWLVFTLVPLS